MQLQSYQTCKIPYYIQIVSVLSIRGGGEDTRLEAKAKDTKKFEAKDQLSEDRPSRGQEQECSRLRPRTIGWQVNAKRLLG